MTTENSNSTVTETEISERPFVRAVKQYELILNKEIQNALTYLVSNPTHSYAQVKLPLFNTLSVEYSNKDGNKNVKKFSMHEAHYGPQRHKKNQTNTDNSYFWNNFLNRDTSIWEKINKDNKWIFNGKACSPFRQRQVALVSEGLYLLDASDVNYDETTQKYKYNINISIYRKPPSNGPFRAKHGYGFIPSIKSIPKVEKKKEQEKEQEHEQKQELLKKQVHESTNIAFSKQPYAQHLNAHQLNMQYPYMHQPYMHSPYMHPPYMHQPYMQQPYMQRPYMNMPMCACPYMYPSYAHVNSPRNVSSHNLHRPRYSVLQPLVPHNEQKNDNKTEDTNLEQDDDKAKDTNIEQHNDKSVDTNNKETDLSNVIELYSTKWFPLETNQ